MLKGRKLTVPARKKRRKFNAGQAARRVAREIVGQPPPERVIPDKRRKPPKHKKSWLEESER